MVDESNYYGVWLVYMLASLGFLSVYWRFTRLPRWPFLKHSLRCLMIALVFTPWYANSTGHTGASAYDNCSGRDYKGAWRGVQGTCAHAPGPFGR